MSGYENAITDYWFAHYATNYCTLCANWGIIDTTGAKTPAGVAVGRKNFCICPNGQALRELDGEDSQRSASSTDPTHNAAVGWRSTAGSLRRMRGE